MTAINWPTGATEVSDWADTGTPDEFRTFDGPKWTLPGIRWGFGDTEEDGYVTVYRHAAARRDGRGPMHPCRRIALGRRTRQPDGPRHRREAARSCRGAGPSERLTPQPRRPPGRSSVVALLYQRVDDFGVNNLRFRFGRRRFRLRRGVGLPVLAETFGRCGIFRTCGSPVVTDGAFVNVHGVRDGAVGHALTGQLRHNLAALRNRQLQPTNICDVRNSENSEGSSFIQTGRP